MRNQLLSSSAFPLSLICLALCSCSSVGESKYVNEADYTSPIRVACVGDSITFGAGIKDRSQNSYPAQLANMLGDQWQVRNFGVNGATLLKTGDRPYWDQKAYAGALAFKPDVVIIKLGTNDSKPGNWRHKSDFVNDYGALIQSFQELESSPRIWICLPVPAFPARWGISDEVIAGEVIPRIGQVAEQTGLPVIDLHAALNGRAEMFPDKIHPDARGADLMAQEIFTAVTGRTKTDRIAHRVQSSDSQPVIR